MRTCVYAPEELTPEKTVRTAYKTRPRSHLVCCPMCGKDFDLLAAPWCGCDRGHPSKLCPSCGKCVCDHPDYARATLWRDPPPALRTVGFDKLFVYYL
jgi:hypothetical protein